jgi:hypothetical protein
MWKHHRTIATSLDAVAEAEDPDLHMTMSHRNITTTLSMGKEANDLGNQDLHTIMRMKKSKWERNSLPAGFAERQYPQDSN